ncbi:Retrotransposon, Ty3-gypsy subclass-like protein [Theobroma cacao]|uniref:Retrotransposon, Ty3-gypsy subclass-like protein n=1 Tax=Theobroma cacao TaxID=3641 RepID=A0A061EC90_THECC|nr:Retrotransposon, Ty3-gypsy subclass-like protein [Theobroma cacao]
MWYQDLRAVYWWEGLKKHVVDYVSRCLICQQVQREYILTATRFSASLTLSTQEFLATARNRALQPLPILEWKWEHVDMDLVIGMPQTIRGYDSIWVIVDLLTKCVTDMILLLLTRTSLVLRSLQKNTLLFAVSSALSFSGNLDFIVLIDFFFCSSPIFYHVFHESTHVFDCSNLLPCPLLKVF